MTDKNKYYDKNLRLPLFSGKDDDWPIWSEKFLIRAKRKGYKDLLLGKVAVPKNNKTGLTEEEEEGDRETKGAQQNRFQGACTSNRHKQEERKGHI